MIDRFVQDVRYAWRQMAASPGFAIVPVIARLKDGVSLAAAQVEANALSRELRGESADAPQPAGLPRIQLLSIKEELVAPIRLPLVVFSVAVGLRTVMVVGQVALTLVLLLAAGLMVKSFVNLTTTDLGYDPNNVLTRSVVTRLRSSGAAASVISGCSAAVHSARVRKSAKLVNDWLI